MIRKKQYARHSHFDYSQISVPKVVGGSKIIYFKRYKPTVELQQETNQLYDILHNNKQVLKKENKETFNRVLQAISFDSPHEEEELKRIFKLLGKVRKVEIGESKEKGRLLYFALVTFKFEFDLVKAFNIEFFQSRVDEEFRSRRLHQTKEGREEHGYDLAKEYGLIEEEDERVRKLKEDGFQVVTGSTGSFKVDREANQRCKHRII